MDKVLHHEDFAPHVEKDFGFVGWPGTLRLTAIEHLPPYPGATRPPFTLMFSGPPREILPEGCHTAIIDGVAGPAFHIMPIHTAARDRQDYQAVFN